MTSAMANRPTIGPPLDPDPRSLDDLPRLRSLGVLADVPWRLSPAVDVGGGLLACRACLEGSEHGTYRPVRQYRELYQRFITIERVEQVATFVERYGFLKDGHWGRQSPASVDARFVLAHAHETREDRRLVLGSPTRRLLLEPELVSKADAWRAAMAAEVSALVESEPDPEKRWLEARSRVDVLSADPQWREIGRGRSVAADRS